MKVVKTPLKGLLVIEPDVYEDHRGWFSESYNRNKYSEHGIDCVFVQDNHSYSSYKGTLRGIHFQINPKAQSKLVRCTRGAILDTAVDLRKGSDTYKKWYSIELSAENKKQLFIPKGFGHAFLTLTDNAEVQYKVDEYYSKEHDRSIRYDDPQLGIEWAADNPVLSEKDRNAPFLEDSEANFSIKVMVTGAKGMLGYDVMERLSELGIDCIGVDREDFDITDREKTLEYIHGIKPDVAVHCAAYTDVDRAEEERDRCWAVNVLGTRNIAEACKAVDARMVYISTDYVFDGKGTQPRAEHTDPNPLNFYGYTKSQGEETVRQLLDEYFIIRTSWLYGRNGKNFVNTMLKLSETKNEIFVVNDQIGAPTYTRDLAVLVCDMLQTSKYGVYHGVNEGFCSWHEFAQEIFRLKGIDVKVNPISTEQYGRKAKRPLNSRLSTDNLVQNGFCKLPSWQDAIKRYLEEV
ncbi:MAG TPA: dTDP-4-dehydrorhamnose reductase [Clostridiales bacterium]|nr:dTDP-4-dehydrorhamnose reductase [Clostridiales bacterium]